MIRRAGRSIASRLPSPGCGQHPSAVHGLLLVPGLFTVAVAFSPPPVRSVDVELITASDYEASLTPAPAISATPPAVQKPDTLPARILPSAPAAQIPATLPADTMQSATRLFTTSLLKEPASAEVRNTLPTLAPYERITQLCNIEATEQVLRALPSSVPETVSASAFAETTLTDGMFSAPGAAFRSHQEWFFIRFECAVSPDLEGVFSFRFALGGPIPPEEWDSHELIAIDEDDE